MVWGTIFKKVFFLIAIGLLTGCGPRAVPPNIDEILVSGVTTLQTGESTALMKEDGVVILLEQANQWTQICTNLIEFADRGIKLDRLDNVNLGFEQPTGSAEIWVADFEFK